MISGGGDDSTALYFPALLRCGALAAARLDKPPPGATL